MLNSVSIPRNIAFRVETLFAGNGNRVGRIKPNEEGVYAGIPMMVLGEVTQQKTFYDPETIMDQMTNPESRFNKVFKQQKLFGEYGHPTFYGLNNDEVIQRLVTVDENNVSHLFTGLYTDAPSANGTVVVRADIKPTGPKGAFLKESLDDPLMNTAFSLRAYVSTDMRPNGLKYRKVRQLTTFDTVGASGYANTDKANALALESFSGGEYNEYEISIMEDGNLMIDQIALERFENTDLNEIFGTSVVSKIIQSKTFINPEPSLIQQFPNLYPKTVFNEFFKEI